jgi:hypothetical protein
MPSELILELLMKQSANRLRQMDEELTAEIRRLQFEAEYVHRALEQKQGGRVQSSTRASALSPATPALDRNQHAPRRASKREPIMRIVREDPERVWMPADVRERLNAEGIDMTTDATRVAMRRMLDDGLFHRGPGGQGFKLASPNGTLEDAIAGPTRNGNSGSLSMTAHSQEGP